MLLNLLTAGGNVTPTPTSLDLTSVTNAFTNSANDMVSQITTIAPIAIGVVTAGLVVTFGVKFFKRITGKA